jgi:maleylacetate reductase
VTEGIGLDPDGARAERAAPDFTFVTRAARVVFAPAEAAGQLPEEVSRFGARRVFVVTTPGRAELARRLVAGLEAGGQGREASSDDGSARAAPDPLHIFDRAVQHVPSELAAAAVARARELGAELCIAIGGGSAVGLAKAVALETRIPVLAVPTTFAGSEMTAVWGMTDTEGKRTGRDEVVAPRTVIYDPELTRGLPRQAAIASAFNAMAHAIGALHAPDANPITDLLAEEAVRLLARALPGVGGAGRSDAPGPPSASGRSSERDPYSDALLGAHLAARVLDATTMGLQHRLSHLLGGSFSLPHAEVHAILLPYVVAHLEREGGTGPSAGTSTGAPGQLSARASGQEVSPQASADVRLRRALSTDLPPSSALLQLQSDLGFARTLAQLGLGRDDLRWAAERWERETSHEGEAPPPGGSSGPVLEILESAFEGAGRVQPFPGIQ